MQLKSVMLQEGEGPVTVTGELNGLTDGDHGFHIHQVSDTFG